MEYQFSRTALTFGKENMNKLAQSRVIVFGIGGVGSFVVEALVRSGIGAIDIVDDETIADFRDGVYNDLGGMKELVKKRLY